MDLAEVIALDFVTQESSGLSDIGGVGSHTGPHEVILEPLVRPLNFALGLRRKCIDNLNTTVGQDLFPLGVDLVGDLVMVPPDGVAALDKTEDGVRVDVIGKRQSVF